MAQLNVAVFLFFNFLTLNSRAESVIDCSTGSSNHTLCVNFQNYPIEYCEEFKNYTLTREDENLIVDVHNRVRGDIARGVVKHLPKGYYLKTLRWNRDLAELAQKWAEQCQTGKVSDYRIFHNELLGRNVAIANWSDPSKAPLSRMIEVWSSGLKHLTPEIVGSYKRRASKAGDFEPVAQMLWWNTSEIGCTRSTYKPVKCIGEGKKTCAKNRAVVQLICTYFPGGNRVAQPVYYTSDDKRLICQYDTNNVLCASVRRSERPSERPNKRKESSYRDSMIHRMRDDFTGLWPLMNSANSLNLNFMFYIYILFFFIYFIY